MITSISRQLLMFSTLQASGLRCHYVWRIRCRRIDLQPYHTYHFHRSIKSYSTVHHPNTTSSGRIKACIDFLSARQWSMKPPINLLGSTWIRPPPSALHGIVCSGAGTIHTTVSVLCKHVQRGDACVCVCGSVCVWFCCCCVIYDAAVQLTEVGGAGRPLQPPLNIRTWVGWRNAGWRLRALQPQTDL